MPKLDKQDQRIANIFETKDVPLSFDDDYDEDYGLVVNVRRLSDKKKFALTLSDLKATDEKSKNYELLDDFSVWFVNYR